LDEAAPSILEQALHPLRPRITDVRPAEEIPWVCGTIAAERARAAIPVASGARQSELLMPRFSLSRLACGLLVFAFLAVPTLATASPAPQASGLAAGISSLWSWLAGLWVDEGCYIDPHGGCRAGTSSVPSVPDQVDEGCYIDPYGGCRG
jgi:hypothetical protein